MKDNELCYGLKSKGSSEGHSAKVKNRNSTSCGAEGCFCKLDLQ